MKINEMKIAHIFVCSVMTIAAIVVFCLVIKGLINLDSGMSASTSMMVSSLCNGC
jgi:hypothetical protein